MAGVLVVLQLALSLSPSLSLFGLSQIIISILGEKLQEVSRVTQVLVGPSGCKGTM